MFLKLLTCVLLPIFLVASSAAASDSVDDSIRTLYRTDAFVIDTFDLEMYLRNAPPPSGGKWGSRERVLQAISDLYALNILAGDADGASLLSREEEQWITEYAVSLERAMRFIDRKVQHQLAATDWDAEATEYYLARMDEYRVEERVSIRTFLLRTEERSKEEAITLAKSLTTNPMTFEAFESLTREVTEDDVAKADGGLMANVSRGMTVPPFEEAIFALTEPGQVSEPIVSQFGVHVAQLIERREGRQRTFEEVKLSIIEELKVLRAKQYRAAIQSEARERQPAGFVRYVEELDALMEETSSGPLVPPEEFLRQQ